MITIYDISKQCGVSPSTVSKALNDYSDVSEKVKKKILDTAREMGYFPNSIARNLITNKSFNIGVVLNDELGDDGKLGLTHSFLAQLLNYFRWHMETAGYDIIFVSNKHEQLGGSYLAHCKSKRIDGLFIVCADFERSEIKELFDFDKPVLAFDYRHKNISTISSNNRTVMYNATKKIIELGYKHFTYCYDKFGYVCLERLKGFKSALEEKGFTNVDYVDIPFVSIEKSFALTNSVIDAKKEKPCIFYTDDYAALGGLQAVQKRKINTPSELALVGFDGIKLTQVFYPKLTTIAQNCEEIGRRAAQKLLSMINDQTEPNSFIEIEAELILRDTCY